jgi:hypothetical protein
MMFLGTGIMMFSGYYWDGKEVKPFELKGTIVPDELMGVPIRFESTHPKIYARFTKEHGCWRWCALPKAEMPKEFLASLLLLNIY